MSRERDAFLDACRTVGPRAVSACPGWTTHEVAAHQAAACAEVVRHVRPHRAGEPVPATRSFAEREAPYLALPFDHLLDSVVAEEERMQAVIGAVLDDEPQAVVPWTGPRMAVSAFRTHLRGEFALHRWNLVGDDATGASLLAGPDLTAHGLAELGTILPRAGAAADPGDPLRVALRSPGAEDVVVEVTAADDAAGRSATGRAGARLRRPGEGETVPVGLELDAASRLLVLWGRRPARPGVSRLSSGTLRRVQHLLAGY
ncbi:maleylpyruvate isomerase N-terminal domain-containing protein [Actinomycetospora soli]|uniref:maleylpyruvate isomerase N-terminal domain-containing protein n=1 Tax=Actinomycetospora soli TaxID=2893887 RepID=UPI001E4C3E73|nr:maleylpyruvate isomerase N-terminal domain-containing protein [Actinomycetospora soli]MCD2190765.1 maleylpyruvate isomerase N-terminal domain-containing protein [Actinomycetospora soli]